jgi:hypothetical protein
VIGPVDRKFRVPRVWSNAELRRLGPNFEGDVVNVSGWQDQDKEGGTYREYFPKARSYAITNWETEARGFQGLPGERFLDLTLPLPEDLVAAYDVVFNHTTLEHIFEVETAFANLCAMTRDIVIVVVPFLQQMHADYGDYWRFTPTAVQRMFERAGLTAVFLDFNRERHASVYVLAVGSKHPEGWDLGGVADLQTEADRFDGFEALPGCRAVSNPLWLRLAWAGRLIR